MKNKLLIICDSHGAGYGTTGFAELITQYLGNDWEVDARMFGGIPVTDILEILKVSPLSYYDAAIVQTGNPDVHPRMPIRPLRWLRSKGFPFMRDSLFSVPPVFSGRYCMRFPFFLLRLIVMRFHQEFIIDIDTLIARTDDIVNLTKRASQTTIIVPIFEVKASVYTGSHNSRAVTVNKHLLDKFPELIVGDRMCSPEQYQDYYNRDGFHFKREYHDLLAAYLAKEMTLRTDVLNMCANEVLEECAV